MTVSGSKSSCGAKVILNSRSMVDRRHTSNRSVKSGGSVTSRMQKQSGAKSGGAETVVY